MDSHHRREALLNWLRSKGTSTASEAADKFGVSTRTILRDVASLRERGEPIESDAGRGGGLRVDLLRSLPPLRVRLDDVVGLFLWYHFTRLSCRAPVTSAAEVAVEKLMGILPPSRAQEIRRTLRRVIVRPGEPDADTGPGDPLTLSVIERSLNTRRGMTFELLDGDGPVTAEPQGMLLEGSSWYLLGTDSTTTERCQWRIDLIRRPSLLEDLRVQHVPLDAFILSATAQGERRVQRAG